VSHAINSDAAAVTPLASQLCTFVPVLPDAVRGQL
jgi:hypothetical protein